MASPNPCSAGDATPAPSASEPDRCRRSRMLGGRMPDDALHPQRLEILLPPHAVRSPFFARRDEPAWLDVPPGWTGHRPPPARSGLGDAKSRG